jgi:hypothetical protein
MFPTIPLVARREKEGVINQEGSAEKEIAYLCNIVGKTADSSRYIDPRKCYLEHFVMMKAFIVYSYRRRHGVCHPIKGHLHTRDASAFLCIHLFALLPESRIRRV